MADVSALIESARSFANDSFSQSKDLVDNATEVINDLGTSFSITGPAFTDLAPVEISTELPEFQRVALDLPEAPQPIDSLILPNLDMEPAPVKDIDKPVFEEPVKPNQLRDFNLHAPTINTSFAFPSPPAALDVHIDAPVQREYEMPGKPQVMLPAFSAMKPTDDVSAPTDYVERFSNAYREQSPQMVAALTGQMDAMLGKINPRFHDQMSALEGRITKFIEGGTALDAATENAIFERSKDKVNAEARRARDAAYTDAARRGFTLPPGVLNSAVNQARVAGLDANARAATDIAVKQAELEQQNIQFAVTTSANLRTAILSAALSYHSNLITINGQALDYSKSILSAAVQVYDTLVKAFSAKLEAYRAEAGVYEVQMRGALAQVQVYQAEIAAVQAMVGVDQTKVEAYKARIDALESMSRVYRSQIDATLGKASLEKLKIELFGEQVRAFSVEAQAKASEWQGYSAAIGGQEARQRAYGEEVRAYVAEVEGYSAKVRAKTANVQQQISFNEGVLRQYVANVDGYRATVDAKSKVASAELDVNRNMLYAFQAKMGSEEARARTALMYYQTKANVIADGTKLVMQATIEDATLRTRQLEAVANTSIAGARVYEGLAGAALSGMNTLVTQTG